MRAYDPRIDFDALVIEKQNDGRLEDLVLTLGEDRLESAIVDGKLTQENAQTLLDYLEQRREEAARRQVVAPPPPVGRPRAATIDQDLSSQIAGLTVAGFDVLEEKMSTSAQFRSLALKAYEQGTLTDRAHSVMHRYMQAANYFNRADRGETIADRFPEVGIVQEKAERLTDWADTARTIFKYAAVGAAVATGGALLVGAFAAGSLIAAGSITAFITSIQGLSLSTATVAAGAVAGSLINLTKQSYNESFRNERMANQLYSELVEIDYADASYTAFNEMHAYMSLLAICSGRHESWNYGNSGPMTAELNARRLELRARLYESKSQGYLAGTGAGTAANIILALTTRRTGGA